MKKLLLIFLVCAIILNLAACAAQAGVTRGTAAEETSNLEKKERARQCAEKNLEIYRLWTSGDEPEEGTVFNRKLEHACENFEVYSSERTEKDGEDNFEYEIINPHTGKRLIRGPVDCQVSVMGEVISGDNFFWQYDSDHLLWVQNFGDYTMPSICYLLNADDSLTPMETDYRLEAHTGWKQRYFFSRHDETDAWRGHADMEYHAIFYGVLDRDLKTVLLPAEYGGWKMDSGVMTEPFFSDGYMFAQRDGKCGVFDYNLKEKIPFTDDRFILPVKAQICRFDFGSDQEGILFLENGKILKSMLCKKTGIHTVIMANRLPDTRETTGYDLIDRNGNVLYTLPYQEEDAYTYNEFDYDENDRPLINGEPLDFPARTEKSGWAAPSIDAARTAGLIPGELDQLYKLNATRRDFCMLAMRLVQALRPKLAADMGAAEASETNTLFWDCLSKDIAAGVNEINSAAKLGIISGYENGSFEPFVPVTRQDAAVILANTAKLLGVEARGEVSQFTDLADAAEYARNAIQAVSSLQTPAGERLMGGNGGKFLPQEPYTIEQAIATMYRLYVIAG